MNNNTLYSYSVFRAFGFSIFIEFFIDVHVTLGTFQIAVFLAGVPLPKSPFTITSKLPIDSSKSIAYGPGLEVPFSQEPTSFSVELKDPQGTLLRDDLSTVLEAILNGQNIPKTFSQGIYTFSYVPPSGKN